MASLTDFINLSSKPLLCKSLPILNNLHVIDPRRVRRIHLL
jgi:hypothetical protein